MVKGRLRGHIRLILYEIIDVTLRLTYNVSYRLNRRICRFHFVLKPTQITP